MHPVVFAAREIDPDMAVGSLELEPLEGLFHSRPPAGVFLFGDGSVLLHSFQPVKETSTLRKFPTK